MIPPRLHTGRNIGRSTLADLAHLGDVAPVADRVAATWHRAAPTATRTQSALRMALEQHQVELAHLFARGVRLSHVARALGARHVTIKGRPISVHAFSMAWVRLERAQSEGPAEMAA